MTRWGYPGYVLQAGGHGFESRRLHHLFLLGRRLLKRPPKLPTDARSSVGSNRFGRPLNLKPPLMSLGNPRAHARVFLGYRLVLLGAHTVGLGNLTDAPGVELALSHGSHGRP